MSGEYSLECARQFRWSSVTGELDAGRIRYLERYLVGTRILDAGCGGGSYVRYLWDCGYRVTGVDIHACFLELAEAGHRGAGFVEADVNRLPFADRTFDSTYCFDVLEHVDNDRQAIRELARVTRKRIILAVPKENDVMARYNLAYLHYTDRTHRRQYTEASLRDLLGCVDSSSAEVFPELPVDVARMARELVVLRPGKALRAQLGWWYLRALLRSPRLLGRARRHEWCAEAVQRGTDSLWATASYQAIFAGLVAVVDLEEGIS